MHVKALQTVLNGTIDVSFVLAFLKMQRLSGKLITLSKLSENSRHTQTAIVSQIIFDFSDIFYHCY